MLNKVITECRSCNSRHLNALWKLAKSPYGDLFKVSKGEATNLDLHDLELILCENCKLLQLSENPKISEIYSSYLYRTTVTNSLDSFYFQIANRMSKEFAIDTRRWVLDIGSNDGTYLLNFKRLGYQVMGVEPTKDSAVLARAKGIETYNGFFDDQAVNAIDSLNVPIGLISVNYTLANVESIFEFLSSITRLMDSETLLSVITGYHPDQFSLNMFEYINHDHISYLTLESFQILCKRVGLRIVDVNRFEHKGGSIQFIVVRETSPHEEQSSVFQLAQREFLSEINTPDFINQFKSKIDRMKLNFHEFINQHGIERLAGIGASISTTHLCYQFEMQGLLSGLYDDDSNKVGKFSPGIGLPVHPLNKTKDLNGEPVLLLAWQHTNRLLNRLNKVEYGGEIFIPLPNTKKISKVL